MKKKRVATRKLDREVEESNPYNFDLYQAFDYFMSAKKSEGLRDSTLVTHDEHFRFFVKYVENHHPTITKISEVTTQLVRDYIVYMREEHMNFKTHKAGLTIQTTNGRVRFLKTMFNLLYKEEIINSNPLEVIKFLKEDEVPFEPLTEEEVKRLFDVLDLKQFPQFRDYVIMNLLYDTGMRVNEVILLTTDDLDIKARRIILPASKEKTRKPRIIPLSSHTIKLLIELINENNLHFESKHIFLNWFGDHMSDDTFRRNLKRYVKKAEITKNFSCHSFRRQFITEALSNGMSLFSLQSIVGHRQISTTRKYVRFDEQTIKNQHELYSPAAKLRRGKIR